jgi:P-type E1-E2 ATPase
MSLMVGIGKGAGIGVLIKNAEALERLEKVDTLVVDKTGTLTEGKPALSKIITAAGFSEDEVLKLAAAVEQASEHPLAQAVVAAAKARSVDIPNVTKFNSPSGKGAVGTVLGKQVMIGSAKFLLENGIDAESLAGQADALRRDGATAIFVAVDKRAAAVMAIADRVKDTTQAALVVLKEDGIRVVMLTGDNRITAEAIGRTLGITEIEADVLPEQKGAVVQRLQHEGRVVAMAGDGTNDAPALTLADVGIAMGTGTDVAIESAGITLERHCTGPSPLGGNNVKHPPEPGFRFCIQRRRCSNCSRRALPDIWHFAFTCDRCRRHGAVIGQRDPECFAALSRENLI